MALWPASLDRAVRMTRAPRLESWRQISKPMPRLAPVTTMTGFEELIFLSSNIVHLSFILARLRQVQEVDRIGCFVDGFLELAPGIAQFDWATRIAEGRG